MPQEITSTTTLDPNPQEVFLTTFFRVHEMNLKRYSPAILIDTRTLLRDLRAIHDASMVMTNRLLDTSEARGDTEGE